MQSPPLLTEKVTSSHSQSEADTLLRGYRLILARAAWASIALVAVALCIADIPPGYARQLTVCRQSLCQNQQATPDMVRALHSAGLSLQFYALFLMTLSIITVSIFLAIALIIAWRKSRDWMGLLVSLTLIIIGTVTFTDYQQLATAYHPIVLLPGALFQFLLNTLPLLVGYLFPDGRFVPRWTRWLALLVILFAGGGTLFPASPFNISTWPGALGTVVQVVIIATILFAQIYRYLRVSTPSQRQQTKWVVFGIAALIIYFIMLFIVGALYPDFTQARSLASLFAEASYILAVIIVPLALAFSILRYRLWDIDLLINRTLVYGTLTAILALIYFGGVILLQNLGRALTGQVGQSPLVIVGSTLAIAALFQPLRRRIQRIIDRRFYRRKYDAARTLAAFSATLRNEVDLHQLREHLLTVVVETMQPTHVSLWLRKDEQRSKPPTNV
ncbi:MAG TPA: hypothetical protein VF026_17220 [Ktedonobacteraceae bacterium]